MWLQVELFQHAPIPVQASNHFMQLPGKPGRGTIATETAEAAVIAVAGGALHRGVDFTTHARQAKGAR